MSRIKKLINKYPWISVTMIILGLIGAYNSSSVLFEIYTRNNIEVETKIVCAATADYQTRYGSVEECSKDLIMQVESNKFIQPIVLIASLSLIILGIYILNKQINKKSGLHITKYG